MPKTVVGGRGCPFKNSLETHRYQYHKGICASQPEQGAKVITALTKLLDQQEEMSEFV